MFNEPESEPLLAVVDDADEEVAAPVPRAGHAAVHQEVDGLPLHRFESVLSRYGI